MPENRAPRVEFSVKSDKIKVSYITQVKGAFAMKKVMVVMVAFLLTLAMTVPAFAEGQKKGRWVADGEKYWFEYAAGGYPASTWDWIDSDDDGVAECYYFDANGYILTNQFSPDGYKLNNLGQWVVQGVVQTQKK
jgi:hypothetical protein